MAIATERILFFAASNSPGVRTPAEGAASAAAGVSTSGMVGRRSGTDGASGRAACTVAIREGDNEAGGAVDVAACPMGTAALNEPGGADSAVGLPPRRCARSRNSCSV
jgi:hypothetical protein